MTHTFATMEVSADTYDEIAQRLHEAGYTHAFVSVTEDEPAALDMHGIALTRMSMVTPGPFAQKDWPFPSVQP